ncbi:MAG: serine/threonine-protein phosphatase, partial [Bryobacterales bacterium]|nr:serine/threonine-protein phosphatase [Bryobacterales bacterium]
RLLYANCGHNPPVLLRAGGGTLALSPTGPGVGLSMRSAYRHAETTLQPGDILLAFTDGITEAKINKRTMLLTSGLSRLLQQSAEAMNTAEETVARIINET